MRYQTQLYNLVFLPSTDRNDKALVAKPELFCDWRLGTGWFEPVAEKQTKAHQTGNL